MLVETLEDAAQDAALTFWEARPPEFDADESAEDKFTPDLLAVALEFEVATPEFELNDVLVVLLVDAVADFLTVEAWVEAFVELAAYDLPLD